MGFCSSEQFRWFWNFCVLVCSSSDIDPVVKCSVDSSFPHYGHSGIVEAAQDLFMQIDGTAFDHGKLMTFFLQTYWALFYWHFNRIFVRIYLSKKKKEFLLESFESFLDSMTIGYFFASTKIPRLFLKFYLYINLYTLGLVVYILKIENGINIFFDK